MKRENYIKNRKTGTRKPTGMPVFSFIADTFAPKKVWTASMTKMCAAAH